MSNEHFDQPCPAAAQSAPAWRPDDNDDAWERVLDCGAPGPAREQPALFYQAQQPRGEPAHPAQH